MARFIDSKFVGGVVDIDGHVFVNVTFERCEVRYSGGSIAQFDGCVFDGCTLGLGGSAANTISYLTAIYGGLGDWGKGSVELLFDQVRAGRPAEATNG